MKHLHLSFVLILLVGLMGLLTACGGESPTATVATTPPTATTGTTEALPTATTAMAADTPTTAPVAADTPTTAAVVADTPTTAAMVADTPTTGTGSGTGLGNAALQAVNDAMKGVKSYHFTLTTDMGATGTTTAEGDMIPPDKMSLTSSVEAAGQKFETKLIRIGTTTWTYAAGQWVKSESPVTVDPTDMTGMGNVTDVEDLGDETIDGVATKHYRYKSTVSNVSGTGEIWVDKSTNYMVQVKSTSETAGTTAVVTIKYSRFNDPSITIEPPE